MFTSGWGQQNQQQQQPQQQTGAFGQPTGFGATNTNNAFGTTSAFAQQQQQQPQVNPMFGNIGAPSTSTFGTANNNATTSAFGVKPATGFGAFSGGTGTFGSGTTTGAFGQPVNNQASTSNSVFGQPASTTTTSAFGAFNKNFGGTSTTATATPPVVTTGSSNPPYSVTTEKDQNVTLQFNSISCMPQYIGYSAEELRVQDYAQGRKTATTAIGAFGQPTAFGATQQTSTGLFGAQPAQPAAPSLFGGTSTTNTTNPAFGAFGQPAATNTGSLFGAFGQPQQQQPQQQQSAFGSGSTFGQPQPQQTNAFGSGQSVFGNNAPKPAFTAFSGGGSGTTNVFGSTPSAFGNAQQPQTQQPPQNLGAFGNTQPANNTSAFSAFGAPTIKPSVFGTQTNTTQPNNSTFGAFGNPQPQQNQPNQPSLFGNNTLFGNQQQQPQNQQQGTQPNPLFGGSQNPAPSLFGNATSNPGSIFGNNQQGQQQQQQQQGQQQGGNTFGSLFGKPAQTTTLFGQGQSQGNTNQPQQNPNPLFASTFGQSTPQGSLFGNKPAAPMLGNSFSGSQGMSTGIFGASTNVPGAQGTMTASISQPISENLPIFAMLPPGPRIVNLEQTSPKKKGGFFVDIPTRSPVPRVLGYTPANSKLRGYGSSLSSSTAGGNGLNGSLITGKPNALALTKPDSRASSLGPDGFLGRSGSPALGSGGRESVKKVILDKKVEPTEFFIKSSSPSTLRSGKITFSPALGLASRERDAIQASTPQTQHLESPTPAPRTNRSPNRFTAQTTKDVTSVEGDEQPSSTELKKGDYWVKPDLQTLKKSGHDQLSVCEGLVVGRKGYGEIHFLESVDLTGLPKLGALLGEVIRFDDKECSVYPDSEEVDKPPSGSGLNVKAKLSLEGCWAVDKATREPITDPNHPSVVKHLKRLKNMKDTHFDSFDMKTGTWIFTVDHF